LQVRNLDIHKKVNNSYWLVPKYLEFQSIICAIENLINRYQQTLKQEQETTNNFAHELRTPLTSLRLNVELLTGFNLNEQEQKITKQITQDAITASNIINDLLDLARVSRTNLTQTMVQLDLVSLSQNLLTKYASLFIKAKHKIEFKAEKKVQILGHANLLAIALRNLLDNALAHNPKFSTTRLIITIDPVQIELITYVDCNFVDNSKQSDLTANLGIGHKLIKQIADIHNAQFITEIKSLDNHTINSFKLVFAY